MLGFKGAPPLAPDVYTSIACLYLVPRFERLTLPLVPPPSVRRFVFGLSCELRLNVLIPGSVSGVYLGFVLSLSGLHFPTARTEITGTASGKVF